MQLSLVWAHKMNKPFKDSHELGDHQEPLEVEGEPLVKSLGPAWFSCHGTVCCSKENLTPSNIFQASLLKAKNVTVPLALEKEG